MILFKEQNLKGKLCFRNSTMAIKIKIEPESDTICWTEPQRFLQLNLGIYFK